MAERLSKIELEEIQKLKENAGNKNPNKSTHKMFLRERHVLYASKATGSDQMQQKLSPHITEE